MRSVVNIAHRGARSLAPENTLAAARKALEIGADLWETDVTVTADGHLILLHDDSLTRTTNAAALFPDRAPWTVSTFSLDEISQLDAYSWFVEQDPFGQIAAGNVAPGELVAYMCGQIPTVHQALLFTQQANWQVNLELKSPPAPQREFPVVPRLLEIMDELSMNPQQVIISSFDHRYLRQVQALRPQIQVQALVHHLEMGPEPEFNTYNAWAEAVDESQIRTAIDHGVAVNLYTVNEESEMRRFMAAGVRGIFTDFPQRLKTLLPT